MLTKFIVVWIATQISSVFLLWVGSKTADHRILLWIGRIAHRRKMVALDRYWPLTKIRPAVTRGDHTSCTIILSLLIGIKSLMSWVFGVIMVFWLPLASLIVPSIITVHDPDDTELMSWIRRVAVLQVTSHALAAALGFAVILEKYQSGESVFDLLRSNLSLVAIVLVLSCGFALAAGRSEASGLMKRGL